MSMPDRDAEEAGRLFRMYIRICNAEFHENDGNAEKAEKECAEVMEALRKLGFTIVTQTTSITYTIRPSMKTLQPITESTHHLVLMPVNLDPYNSKEAILRIATARSRFFGQISSSDAHTSLSAQDEQWFRSQIDFLLPDNSNKDAS